MLNRSTLFTQEFSSCAPTILSFGDVVQHIYEDLACRGFNVGIRCGEPFKSEIVWYTPQGPIVFIYPYSGTEEHPLNALWDMIHEWGHSFGDPPPCGYKCDGSPESLQRETRASNLGWSRAVESFPSLSEREHDFWRRHEENLDTYRLHSR